LAICPQGRSLPIHDHYDTKEFRDKK
jgi:hypothetical protein